jgi:GDPmannose 4,6-dehydratase
MKKVLITGVTGQTGSILVENYLKQGDYVHGMIRRNSNFNTRRIDHVYNHPNLKLFYGDLADYGSICSAVSDLKPDYFINCGAQSYVKASFDIPEYTFDIDATGTIRCLEAIRKFSKNTKFLQCSTSELYGSTPPPQSETTSFHPRSPYGAAKIAAYWATVNYREAYNMFAVNSISFNHENSKRSEHFVTRKITRAATRIKLGLQDKLTLGNLEAKRDWCDARDIARGQMMMLDSDVPDDYVLCSGKSRSVKEFADIVFSKLGLNYQDYVEVSDKHFRPSEVDHLCGDYTKINKALGWEPLISFDQMVEEMIDHDLKLAQQEQVLAQNGFKYTL